MDTKELAASLKKIPWWGYAGGGGVVLALAYYVRKQSHAPTVQVSNAPGANVPDQGLQLADLAGMPYETFDPSYHSYPYPDGQNPSGYDPTTTPASGAPRPISTAPVRAPWPGGFDRPLATPAPTPTPPAAPSQQSPSQPGSPSAGGPYWHEVHAWPAWDSTLSGVGGHYGMSWQQLYDFGNDRQIIDSTAHAHGHYGDEYNWLFPGERLQVPSAS